MSKTVSEFLESFPIPLQHRKALYDRKLWVFWSQNDQEYQNISSLADSSTQMIYEKIKFAFSDAAVDTGLITQFWTPVKIEGRLVLSTSGQPFAVRDLSDPFATYRLNSEKYQYIIDDNNLNVEPDPMIIRGGPATAFLNRMPCMDDRVWFQFEPDSFYRSSISIMIPICSPFDRCCVGVVECTISEYPPYGFYTSFFSITRALKRAGLNMLHIQENIPYQTINGLRPTRDEIAKALEIVCAAHNLTLAQVWIAYEDKSNVPFSSSLDDTRPTKMLALKLTGYLSIESSQPQGVEKYYRLCDIFPQEMEELALKTLKDHESRYISNLRPGRLMYHMPEGFGSEYTQTSALAICLRSTHTGYFDYAFEFIWLEHSNNVILLEAILLTLKRCLPSFNFAYGVELGNEVDIIDVDSSTDFETTNIKIFKGKKPKPMIVDYIAPSHVKFSESTLKRKFKDLGVPEWPGPKLMNGNPNDSSVIQIDTNEEDNLAVLEH